MAVDALEAHQKRQQKERRAVAEQWSDQGLVFASRTGVALDVAAADRPEAQLKTGASRI
jgi:hypothetical protein